MIPAILTGDLVLLSRKTVATDTLKLNFEVQNLKTLTGEIVIDDFDFIPGQFVSIGFTATAWRAYSIASTPTEDTLELVVRIVEGGVGSEALNAAKIGDTVPFKGPFGHFQLSENKAASLYFCATGTGIAPFRPMIIAESQQAQPRPMTLLYGGKDADDIAYLEDLHTWSAALNVQLGLSRDETLTTPPGFKGEVQASRITAILEKQELEPEAEFYLCGNGSMVKSVQEILEAKEVHKAQIFMERFN